MWTEVRRVLEAKEHRKTPHTKIGLDSIRSQGCNTSKENCQATTQMGIYDILCILPFCAKHLCDRT